MINPTTLSRYVVCGLAAGSFLAACAESADEPAVELHRCEPIAKDRADRDLLQAIDAMGLCGSSAIDVGDGYQVEGDIYIAKATLADKQARHQTLVSTTNIRDVTIRIGSGIPNDGGEDDWWPAVQAAVVAWNAVPYNLVRLVYTTGPSADITVDDDNGTLDDDITLARAGFPANGQVGTFIEINLDYENNWPISAEQKLHNALHEIGHTIGLRHTNWATYGETGATNIPGTPTSDAASVMNYGSPFASTGLSSNDQLAIRLIYPEVVTHINEYAGCSGSTPRLVSTWGGTLVQPTIEWQLERYTGGTWNQVYRGTAQTWTFNVQTGTTLKARVRGRSSGGWSVYRGVTRTAPSCGTPPQ